MEEIKVNYSNIDSHIARLSILKQRVEFYTVKKNRMEVSKGNSRDGLVKIDHAFADFASYVEAFINKTIEEANYVKEEFTNADLELSKKLK